MKKFFMAMGLIVMAFTAVAISKTRHESRANETILDYILPVIEMEAYSEDIMDGAGLPLCFKNAKEFVVVAVTVDGDLAPTATNQITIREVIVEEDSLLSKIWEWIKS